MHRLCGRRAIDPAHLIPRSLGGCGGACAWCHSPPMPPRLRHGELDLLPYLEPAWRSQLADAVGHVGLIGALRRISGDREGMPRRGYSPIPEH